MKTAVVFIADGSEEIEALTPVDYLRRAGVEVTLVSVSGRTIVSSHNVSINVDMTFDSYLATVQNNLPDAVVVPGGMPGSSNIASIRSVINFISEMYKNNKLVCAICAAPALVLSVAGVLEGNSWTCYPGMQNQECATPYNSTFKDDVPFVHDKNLITGRGPGAAEEFSMEIVRTLQGNEIAEKIKIASVQR